MMASGGYGQAQDQVKAMVAEAKGLTVDKLKNVLRQEGLTVSGIKSELQIRIIAHIEKMQNAGDQEHLDRLRSLIRNGTASYNPPNRNTYPSPYSNHTPASSASPQFSSPAPRISHPSTNGYSMSSGHPFGNNRVNFKSSPFYTITKPLASVVECKARETTRDTARVSITLSVGDADQLQRDENTRIMVFCAAESYPGSHGQSEIAFPHQVELKCNADEVKANLRGLKNKPGSTRPVDITKMIRKKPNYPNLVEMIYALTTKKFYLVVNLVQKRPIDALVADLRRGKFISKERVLQEMRSKAADPDIVATSSVLSLKCPLSATRIMTPCRSIGCNHNQCFDAASYLQLQEQAPTWKCPVCDRAAGYENLVIDQYMTDILNSTSTDTEQVTVEPDGRWHLQEETKRSNSKAKSQPTPDEDDDDDEDLIEISDARTSHVRNEMTTPSSVRTPPFSIRDDSRAPSTSRSTSKRPREVIDLTLSDEEDAPRPKIKRPSMSSTDSFRSRPPDRYQFQLPYPPHSSGFNFDRFGPTF